MTVAKSWMTGDEFHEGDIVTRDGTDRQRIVAVLAQDLIEVECIKEPLGALNEDGTRDGPWCKLGERETNLTRRYSFPDELTIEGCPDCVNSPPTSAEWLLARVTESTVGEAVDYVQARDIIQQMDALGFGILERSEIKQLLNLIRDTNAQIEAWNAQLEAPNARS